MPAWTDYTSKTTPADTDELMLKDYSDSNKANKRILFSGIWNWIVNKLTNAVITKLETSPQTIVGAINSLNSKMIKNNLVNDYASKIDVVLFIENLINSGKWNGNFLCASCSNAPTTSGLLNYSVTNGTAKCWILYYDLTTERMYKSSYQRSALTDGTTTLIWTQVPTETYANLTTTAKDSLVSAVNEVNNNSWLLKQGIRLSNLSLKNIKTPGTYYSNSGTNTATLTDIPDEIKSSFVMHVWYASGNDTNYITQQIDVGDKSYRNHMSGYDNWSGWSKIEYISL